MRVELQPSPNRYRGRGGEEPRAIVVHTTEGPAASAIRWFSSERSQVSAHYLVALDGAVTQFVDEEDTARHAGDAVNPWTIGIEFEDDGEPATIHRPDRQYRIGAELLREVSNRWNISLDREHVVGHRKFKSETTCPGNLDIDRLVRLARGTALSVVCLLPARNAAGHLPGYFASASMFCDAVVALDDGSTDDTRALLERRHMVAVLLTNPPREGFSGWDDGANRNRLLRAAAELEPEWIVSIDADERIEASDAVALREFLAADAVPGCAYGFQHYRMWGDRSYEPSFVWIYRLFAHEAGQEFPTKQLHFNPVPTSIPRSRWVRTTIRVQHFGAVNEAARMARLAKYRDADPEGRYRTDYGGLADAPSGELLEWQARKPDLEVLQSPQRRRRWRRRRRDHGRR